MKRRKAKKIRRIIAKFKNAVRRTHTLNWQTTYDEKYLDLSGNKITGGDFDSLQNMDKFRVAFFFHYLDTSKPLISQYGLINLREATDLPDRLSGIINYEPMD